MVYATNRITLAFFLHVVHALGALSLTIVDMHACNNQ